MIYGAMYSMEPKKVEIPFQISVQASILERPQSVSLRCPSSVNKIFQGLSSLQTIPCLCKNQTATMISLNISLILAQGKTMSCFLKQKQRSPLGRYYMTIQTFSQFWKISTMLVRKGFLRMSGSSLVCSRFSYLIFDFGIIFIAKRLFVIFYSAKTTKPQEPFPRYFTHWQCQGPLDFFYSFFVSMNDLVSSFTVLYGSGGVRVIGTILFGTEGAA